MPPKAGGMVASNAKKRRQTPLFEIGVFMVSVYNDQDFQAVIKQRNRVLTVFWIVTGVYALSAISLWIYFMSLPYAHPDTWIPKLIVSVLSIAYVIFVFPFMGIKFHRVNRYYKMMYYLSEGLKNEEENYFICYEKKDLQKDFVDVVGCVFKTWSKKRHEWLEREAYFDPEKPLPKFSYGDLVHYVVQSNFIIQYEVVQKGALDNDEREIYLDELDEEYEEYDEYEEVDETTSNENA